MRSPLVGYLAGVFGVMAVALILWPFYPHVRALTAGNSLVVIVLVVAWIWGIAPAVLTSVVGALYLNYFYVPPLLKFDFRVDGSEDIAGLAAFLLIAVIVSRKKQEAFDRAIELEGLRRNEEFKSALLDTVTHDLRTPLTSIKAAASALMSLRNGGKPRTQSPESEKKLLEIIVGQSDVLNRFIEAMIELAEIESSGDRDRQNVETTPVDEIIIAALARAEDALREREVEVECDENLTVMGHPKAIAQVLFSLLENAGKYAPPATPVRLTAWQDEFGEVRIAVEDEGPGVPPALRERVFEKFFRGSAFEEKRQHTTATGLGLGLAIARRIVEAQGGRIWIEERAGGKPGARFVFTVPALPVLSAAPVSKEVAQ